MIILTTRITIVGGGHNENLLIYNLNQTCGQFTLWFDRFPQATLQ